MRISISIYILSRRNSIKFLTTFRTLHQYTVIEWRVNATSTFVFMLITSKGFAFQKSRWNYCNFLITFSTMCLNFNRSIRYTLIPERFKCSSDCLTIANVIDVIVDIVRFTQLVSFFTLEFPYFCSLI